MNTFVLSQLLGEPSPYPGMSLCVTFLNCSINSFSHGETLEADHVTLKPEFLLVLLIGWTCYIVGIPTIVLCRQRGGPNENSHYLWFPFNEPVSHKVSPLTQSLLSLPHNVQDRSWESDFWYKVTISFPGNAGTWYWYFYVDIREYLLSIIYILRDRWDSEGISIFRAVLRLLANNPFFNNKSSTNWHFVQIGITLHL